VSSWTHRPTEADWVDVTALLDGAGTSADDPAVLLAHVYPDADALGSALSVGLALRERGRHVQVSFGDDPFVLPRILEFLPGLDLLVPPSAVRPDPALVVTFDASSIDRLGVLADNVKAAGVLVAVDHHASYTGFAQHHLVDVASPATAVLAGELVRRRGVDLTPDIATTVYAGLLTDTGSFRYSATTPATHVLAAELLEAGVPHDRVAREVYDSSDFGYVQVLGAALSQARLEPASAGGRGLVWTTVSAAARAEHGLGMDAVEPVIDTLRVAREAEVAAVLKEDDDGSWRVSTRSRGTLDVSRACLALGGGGHRLAAGFTSRDDVDGTLAALRAQLDLAAADLDSGA
jgi:phosphoesterase RecJ-like protein